MSAGANGHYTLSGGGFGHGIGFSQYGADKLAKAGSSYKDIIGYYYKDVTVVDISSVRSEQWYVSIIITFGILLYLAVTIADLKVNFYVKKNW